MSRESFRKALFAVIEQATRTELRVSSQLLILAYFNGSNGSSSRERARETVERYTQEPLPSEAELAERERQGALTKLDKLVLAMDQEAEVWDRA